MKLTILHHDNIGDWYTIERAEHDGRTRFEQTGPNCQSFRMSCRLGNACVEGHGHEMLSIATSIEARTGISFRRCAVRFDGDKVFFWSPRNSDGDPEPCTIAEADELAALIRKSVTMNTETQA